MKSLCLSLCFSTFRHAQNTKLVLQNAAARFRMTATYELITKSRRFTRKPQVRRTKLACHFSGLLYKFIAKYSNGGAAETEANLFDRDRRVGPLATPQGRTKVQQSLRNCARRSLRIALEMFIHVSTLKLGLRQAISFAFC